MNTQAVIMNQPQVVLAQHQSPQWQTDLMDCCSDCGVCLCGLFCPLILGCQIASAMEECCLCGSSMAMRSVYRTKYGIPGSLLGDFCAIHGDLLRRFAHIQQERPPKGPVAFETIESAAWKMNPQLVITQQPQVVVIQPSQHSYWQTGLCDCFSDCGVCLCGTFCYVCLGCQVAADMNECCLCGTSVAMRSVYRTKYGIPGSICDDYCTLWCYPQCALCQLKRDINRRREQGIF
ncbi:Hypothetical predicted protein [Podarcis lilfordi]|uniref:Placenta associated 8 n=1 Tax=Podarcis lilfordi TaxID=74358 RepID=A0AA35KWA9_9SAUR|nr:Hypothetical predicted protein [Podarcis lilfordi]